MKAATIGAAILCLLAAVPATAGDRSGDKEAAKAKPVKTCRVFRMTGSRMPTRICHTETEWRDERVQNGRMIDGQINAIGQISRRQTDVTGGLRESGTGVY